MPCLRFIKRACVFTAVLLAVSVGVNENAQAGKCDGHCYEIIDWDANENRGASSSILTYALSVPNPATRIAASEMWVKTDSQGAKAGWVETGATVGMGQDGNTNLRWFYAELRCSNLFTCNIEYYPTYSVTLGTQYHAKISWNAGNNTWAAYRNGTPIGNSSYATIFPWMRCCSKRIQGGIETTDENAIAYDQQSNLEWKGLSNDGWYHYWWGDRLSIGLTPPRAGVSWLTNGAWFQAWVN